MVETEAKAEIVHIDNAESMQVEADAKVVVKDIQGSNDLAEAKLLDPPKPFSKPMLQLYAFCLVGFLCSSMNGFDGSLMSSLLVMVPFQEQFGAQVDGVQAGIITAMYQIGSASAIPFIAISLDRFGRRFGMFVGCFLVVVGTVIEGTCTLHSNSTAQFFAGRFFLGFGVVLATAAAPTYVVELAHPAYRGTLTGLYNCQYFIGSIIANGATRGSLSYTDNRAWLIPTWIQLILPGLVCVFVWLVPETPRFLYTRNKKDKAIEFLTKYHGLNDRNNAYVVLELREFEERLDMEGSEKTWWDFRILFNSRASRYRLACNLVMSTISQLSTGGLGYFVGAFLKTCGITQPVTVLNFNLGTSFISPFVAYYSATLCDKLGRRPQFLGGLLWIIVCWIVLTICTAIYAHTGSLAAGRAAMAFNVLSGVGGSFGFTPLQALYPVECLSYEMRAKGMAFQSFVTSASLLINQFGTPVAMQKITWKFYVIITVWDIFEFVCAYFLLVETRGFTLEELDLVFQSENPRKTSLQKRKVVVLLSEKNAAESENDRTDDVV